MSEATFDEVNPLILRQRYPDSPYTKQAENRIRIAEDVLAASEMDVGRYYQQRNNHAAAINTRAG